MQQIPVKYWLYQLFGWGVYFLVNLFFAFTFGKFNTLFITRIAIAIVLGFLLSHLMRAAILGFKVMLKPLRAQLFYFLCLTLVFAMTYSFIDVALSSLLKLRINPDRDVSDAQRILAGTFNSFIILLLWNIIYFIYHYVEKSRKQQLDTLRLEAMVKELELKTIKSHINPHFIFNSLNSIRALVDENPSRARTAITELSNILRSSMSAEKAETVTLERELGIVKDYLALEHIRFEDRLQVEYEVDEDTLDQPVPPMMLQTLVENAIKHGIGKRVEGGVIRIISDFRLDHHELIVQNTGRLSSVRNGDGFGLASTVNRLQLLYGKQASFSISDIGHEMVEAKVILPVAVVA
jgi:two-component system, LytTR family, sensor kinase